MFTFSKNTFLITPILIFITCLLLSNLTPPFQAADEADHTIRAYLLTHGVIRLDSPQGKSSGGFVDSNLILFMDAFRLAPDNKVSIDLIKATDDLRWSENKIFSSAPGTGYYFPLIYLPQALGLGIGQSLKFSISNTYKIARIFALFFFCIVLGFAFWVYKPPILVIALLVIPMSLFQTASTSLDVVANGLTILSLSLFLRIAVNKNFYSKKLVLLLCLSIFLVGASRPQAFPLVLLIFYLSFNRKNTFLLICGIVTCLSILAWLGFSIPTIVDKRVSLGAPMLTLIGYYCQHPLHLAQITYSTLADDFQRSVIIKSFMGLLGWFDLYFSIAQYWILYGLLFLILVLSIPIKKIKLHSWQIILLISGILCIFLIFLAVLVAWNTHPAKIIYGIQGRYFLIPALLFAYIIPGTNDDRNIRGYINYFILFILLVLSSYFTSNLLLTRYFIPTDRSLSENINFIKPNSELEPLALNSQNPLTFNLPLGNIRPLKGFAVLLKNGMPSSSSYYGQIEFTTLTGERLLIPIESKEIENGRYKLFELDRKPYIKMKIEVNSNAEIEILGSRNPFNQSIEPCFIYIMGDTGEKRFTLGCPAF